MTFSTVIDAGELAKHLDDPAWLVFDCRFDLGDAGQGGRDYDAGHIPGARYAHLDDDLAGPISAGSGRHPLPEPAALVAWLRANGMHRDTQVVVYDGGPGAMASRLWWMLRHWLGHPAVALLQGGWSAWQAAGLPTATDTPAPRPGDFQATADDSRVIDTEALAQALERDAVRLIDARMPPRFKGEMEPLDRVPGHVPGAINLPFPVNLVEGRFDDAERLRAHYLGALDGVAPADTVCMCGSGVTACHDLLAMDIAGLSGARLYVGSWSAWCSNPSRPVASDA